MPNYNWIDRKTEKKVEVYRDFAQYQEIPTREEASVLSAEEYDVAEWERTIGKTRVAKSYNWQAGGSKGNWLLAFCLIGATFLMGCKPLMDIRTAVAYCKCRGGVVYVRVNELGYTVAKCNDVYKETLFYKDMIVLDPEVFGGCK